MKLRKIAAVGLMLISAGLNAQLFLDTLFLNEAKEQVEASESMYTRIVTNDTSGLIRFLVRDYNSNNQLVFKGYFKSLGDYIKTGEHIEYYTNGLVKSKKTYINNALNGTYQLFSASGELIKSVQYSNGAMEGSFITYYSDGSIRRKDNYTNNKFVEGTCYTRQGTDTTYYPYIIAPRFKGGWQGFNTWITNELSQNELYHSELEKSSGIISVTINQKGFVDTIHILRGGKSRLIQEAVTLIKASTGWMPGLVDGKPSDLTIKIPLDFNSTSPSEK